MKRITPVSYTHLDVYKRQVMKLGDNSANMNVETVPTGSLSLDIALGLGGLPKGRIIAVSYTHLDVYKRQTWDG